MLLRQFIREAIQQRRMPVTRQQTSWTCGPASLKAVTKLMKGLDVPEKKLADIADANYTRGTTSKKLVAACQKLGLDAEAIPTLDNGQLRKHIQDGSLVILDVDMWDGEHWVVLHACDDKSFTLMDPAVGESLTIDDKALDGIRWNKEDDAVKGGIIIRKEPV